MRVTCRGCGHRSHVGGPHTKNPLPWVCSQCKTLHGRSGEVYLSAGRPRPNWNEYFMGMAVWASKRATCDRRHVGCVVVSQHHQVVCTGYNGSAPGAPHCDDMGHLIHDGHCVRTIHAEANAVAQAAQAGKSTLGCVIYVTCHPCPTCLMLLAAAGILDVVYLEPYHLEEDCVSTVLADAAAMNITQYEGNKSWG